MLEESDQSFTSHDPRVTVYGEEHHDTDRGTTTFCSFCIVSYRKKSVQCIKSYLEFLIIQFKQLYYTCIYKQHPNLKII